LKLNQIIKSRILFRKENHFSALPGRRLLSGPTAEAGPACSAPAPASASARALARARSPRQRDRPWQTAHAAWRPHAGDAPRVAVVAPRSRTVSAFICSARCSLPRPRAPSLPRTAIAPPPRTITGIFHLRATVPAQRTRLFPIRLATRSATSSYPPNGPPCTLLVDGKAQLSVFPRVPPSRAAELVLRHRRPRSLFLSLHHAFVFAFSTRSFCSPRLARSRPEAAAGRRRPPHRCGPGRGHAPLSPRCSPGQGGLGPKPKPGRRACFPARALGPKAVAGRLASLGRPVSNQKSEFSFFFYYLKVEMVWKMFDYSNLL
jgi:hypothetical protein